MNGWDVVLEGEDHFLGEVAKRLDQIGKDIDSLGRQDEALELVYSAMKSAFELADAEMGRFAQEIVAMEQAAKQGQINLAFLPPPIQQQIGQAPPQNKEALAQLVICFRVCMSRPSDVFRNELRRQIGVVAGGLQQVIMSSPAQAQASVANDVKNLCTLMCAIEQPFERHTPESPQGQGWSWGNLISWQGAATILASMIAGHFAVRPAMHWADNKLGLGWFPEDEYDDDTDVEDILEAGDGGFIDAADREQNDDGSEEFDE